MIHRKLSEFEEQKRLGYSKTSLTLDVRVHIMSQQLHESLTCLAPSNLSLASFCHGILSMCYPMLRNSASGPGIGLPGRISPGF